MDNTENSAAAFKDSATSVLTPKPRKRYIKDFVRIWIEKKRKNPRQIKLLSDIHYDLVKPLAEAGFDIDKLSPKQKKRRRETITVRYPKDICDELGITRASIGLYTGDVAHMYFRGNRHSINIAEIPKLQHKGTDILVIEKEGIAERLRHYAAKSEDEKKEELQHTIQTNVEELGGGGEGSLITGPEEIPITEAPKKKERMVNVKRPTPKKRVPDSTKSMVNISKQLERQATQLARIEKVVLPLQKSVNRIDKQSNTMKQLYTVATQLQRQVRSTKNRKQNQGVQRKRRGKSLASSKSKKRSLKGKR